MRYLRPPFGSVSATSCVVGPVFDMGPERRYPITCHECGQAGEKVGKELPTGWRWWSNGMYQRHYCPDIVCWDRSWSRLREEWASA